MKKTILLSLILVMFGYIFGQNEVDAYRFSEAYYTGTARSMAMGNAFGALGADLSTASTNPAGIGLYKHYEMTFSPALSFSKADANFAGTNAVDDKMSLKLSNLGMSFGLKNLSGDLKAVNFAFGYNIYNNFSHHTSIAGVNNYGSMLDAFMLNANGYSPDELDSYHEYLAWDTWLLDTVSGQTNYYTNPLWGALQAGDSIPDYGENQSRIQHETGYAGEYFFTAALNYKDLLYFGATIGLQSIKYSSMLQYTENNFSEDVTLNSYTFTEVVNDNGSGINAKFGLIVRPVDFIRIGGSIQTPTYFTIKDRYYTSMASYWRTADADGNTSYESGTQENLYTYNILSPMRINGDLGIVIGKIALIGVNYEYVDYSAMRMSAPDYMFVNENNAIRDNFQAVNNYRAGAEIRLGPLSLRGGYALFGSPYRELTGLKFDYSKISAGIGIHFNNVYLDFAYVYGMKKYNVYLYNGYTDEPVPQVSMNDNMYNLTLGIKL